jgi:hypothetical protein
MAGLAYILIFALELTVMLGLLAFVVLVALYVARPKNVVP